MAAKVRIGFVGAGFMGQLAHIRSYALLHQECELVALAEPRQRTAELVAGRYGIGRVYRDHRELVESEQLDGIVAAQPYRHHASLLPELYPHVPHLFTEKPLALAAETGDRLAQLAREAGCVHMLGYQRRSDPATREAKRTVDAWKASGELGALRYLRICYSDGDWTGNARAALIDVGEQPPPVPAEAEPPERLLVFESESGIPATIEVTPYRLSVEFDEEILVAFERGYVRLRPAPSLAVNRSGTLELHRDPGGDATPERIFPELPWIDPQRAQAADFLRVCRGEAAPPTDAAEAAEDLHLVAEIVRARVEHAGGREALRSERDEATRAWEERLRAMDYARTGSGSSTALRATSDSPVAGSKK